MAKRLEKGARDIIYQGIHENPKAESFSGNLRAQVFNLILSCAQNSMGNSTPFEILTQLTERLAT